MAGPRYTSQHRISCIDAQGNRTDVIEQRREFVGPALLATGQAEIEPLPSQYSLQDKTTLEVLDEVTFEAEDGRRFTRI